MYLLHLSVLCSLFMAFLLHCFLYYDCSFKILKAKARKKGEKDQNNHHNRWKGSKKNNESIKKKGK